MKAVPFLSSNFTKVYIFRKKWQRCISPAAKDSGQKNFQDKENIPLILRAERFHLSIWTKEEENS
jgi:hypothetical protein